MDRRCVSQIMQPGLKAPTVGSLDTSLQTQLGKYPLNCGTAYSGTPVGTEKASIQ